MTSRPDVQVLLERLAADADLRGRFELDPAATARSLGLDRLADELAAPGRSPLQPLDLRESRSSLAGALLATAAEAVSLFELGGHVLGASDAQAATGPPSGHTWNPDEFGANGSGGPPTADVEALLHNHNVAFDATGIADLKAGRIDPRLVDLLNDLSVKHRLTISAMCSDHPKYTTGGSISNHYFGRAFDIATVDGKTVNAGNEAARRLALELAHLDPGIRPSEIGSPWALPGAAYFTDADHQNHLHVGFDAPIAPNWHPPAGEVPAAPADANAGASPDAGSESDSSGDSAHASSDPSADPSSPSDDTSDGDSGDDGLSSDYTGDGDSGDDGGDSGDDGGDSGDDGGDDGGDSGDDGGDSGSDSEQQDDGSGDDGESGGDSDSDSDSDSDAPGEGSNGEDANDDASDGSDSSDSSDSSDTIDNSDSTDNSSAADTPDNSDSSAGSENSDNSDDAVKNADGSGAGGSDPPPESDGAGSSDAMAESYPGDDASRDEVAAWMASEAQARGLPRELPIMASLVESGLRNLDYGDADSVGFFQMRTSIWNHGAYAGYADRPELQLRWFLEEAEAVRAKRVAEGLPVDDPRHYGDWIADIERPAEQYRGRYQLRLDEARGLLAEAASKPKGSSINAAQVLNAVKRR